MDKINTKKLLRDIELLKSETKTMIADNGVRKTSEIVGIDKGSISRFLNGKRDYTVEFVIEIYERLT